MMDVKEAILNKRAYRSLEGVDITEVRPLTMEEL